jgi:hypothetical protein
MTPLLFSPSEQALNLAPGRKEHRYFQVINQSEESLDLDLFVNPWSLAGTSMTPLAGEEESLQRSAVEWISVHPATVHLRAGSQRGVRVTMVVPPEAQGEYFAQIEARPMGAPEATAYPEVLGLALTAGDQLPPEIALEELTWDEDEPASPGLCFAVANTGRVTVWPDINLFLQRQDSAEDPLRFTPDAAGRILPGTRRRYYLPLHSTLAPGNYLATLVVQPLENAPSVSEGIPLTILSYELDSSLLSSEERDHDS